MSICATLAFNQSRGPFLVVILVLIKSTFTCFFWIYLQYKINIGELVLVLSIFWRLIHLVFASNLISFCYSRLHTLVFFNKLNFVVDVIFYSQFVHIQMLINYCWDFVRFSDKRVFFCSCLIWWQIVSIYQVYLFE